MKAVLIDDEELALIYLEHQLKSFKEIEIKGRFTEPQDGIKFIEENEIDIVFLDIQMPGIDGLHMAEILLEKRPELNVVFVTAFEKYAIKAFELNALDYLLKPITKERITNTLNRIEAREKPIGVGNKDENLRLNLFRQLEIVTDENKVVTLKWRTSKAEQLFLYLVREYGKEILVSTIIDTIWAHTEYEKALKQLYTTVYQTRKALSPYKEYFEIKNTINGYMLVLNKVEIDIEEFDNILKENKKVERENVEEFERAIEICNGEYLGDLDYTWCEMDRQRYLISWINIAYQLVEWYEKNNEMDKVSNLCFKIIERYPLEEEAYFYIMKISAKQSRILEVEKIYTELKKTLKEIDEEVDDTIISWYKEWKNR